MPANEQPKLEDAEAMNITESIRDMCDNMSLNARCAFDTDDEYEDFVAGLAGRMIEYIEGAGHVPVHLQVRDLRRHPEVVGVAVFQTGDVPEGKAVETRYLESYLAEKGNEYIEMEAA